MQRLSSRVLVLVVLAVLIGLLWGLAGGGLRGLWILAAALATAALPIAIDLIPGLLHAKDRPVTTLGLNPTDEASVSTRQ